MSDDTTRTNIRIWERKVADLLRLARINSYHREEFLSEAQPYEAAIARAQAELAQKAQRFEEAR